MKSIDMIELFKLLELQNESNRLLLFNENDYKKLKTNKNSKINLKYLILKSQSIAFKGF